MSYYILGAVVAFVYSVQCLRKQGILVALILAALWPIVVPAAPFFWLYSWSDSPRPERDLYDQHHEGSHYTFDPRNRERYIEELRDGKNLGTKVDVYQYSKEFAAQKVKVAREIEELKKEGRIR
jgi:hypothetical protein